MLHWYLLRAYGHLEFPSNTPIRNNTPPYDFVSGCKPSNLFGLHYEKRQKNLEETFSLTTAGLYDLGLIKY